ncbi:AraC family transcriptional regulator [Lewinellaceae bacterium SD302]|nr:AraC family transcriptional regulator [Lewinellaceae bacterium SD302]
MILLPTRLFQQPTVTTLLRSGNNCILEKRLEENTGRREGYLATHAVSIVLSGRQVIESYDGDTISIQPGEAILLRRGLYHISDFVTGNNGFHSLLCYFEDNIINKFLADRPADFRNSRASDFVHLPSAVELNTFARSTLDLYRLGKPNRPAVLQLKQLELLHLSSDLPGLMSTLCQFVIPKKRGIRDFMESNYHKQLGVEDYARLTGRSTSSFRRDFKAHFGTTPQRWLKGKRMAAAVEISQRNQISVSRLAHQVGYENVSYFIREFREHTGYSPRQFMLREHS